MERDIRFDLMRGVGILLMMLGHIPVEGFAYKWIYSFHMPMFFILSGLFTKTTTLFAGGGYSRCFKITKTNFTTIRGNYRSNSTDPNRSMRNAR